MYNAVTAKAQSRRDARKNVLDAEDAKDARDSSVTKDTEDARGGRGTLPSVNLERRITGLGNYQFDDLVTSRFIGFQPT